MSLLIWALIVIGAIAFFFAFSPVMMFVFSFFEDDTRMTFFRFGGWREYVIAGVIGWCVLIPCAIGVYYLR